MGLFDLFGKSTKMADGLAEAAETPGSVILDVRNPQEYKSGHIPGSINLPLDRVHTIKISKGKPLFVYCHSGARSAHAVSILNKNGYNAKNIGGIASYNGPLE